jgi:hypothetical protein
MTKRGTTLGCHSCARCPSLSHNTHWLRRLQALAEALQRQAPDGCRKRQQAASCQHVCVCTRAPALLGREHNRGEGRQSARSRHTQPFRNTAPPPRPPKSPPPPAGTCCSTRFWRGFTRCSCRRAGLTRASSRSETGAGAPAPRAPGDRCASTTQSIKVSRAASHTTSKSRGFNTLCEDTQVETKTKPRVSHTKLRYCHANYMATQLGVFGVGGGWGKRSQAWR